MTPRTSDDGRLIEFEGVCPFLTCLEKGSHSHTICQTCGAVRHGNAGCDDCRSHWPGGDPMKEQEGGGP